MRTVFVCVLFICSMIFSEHALSQDDYRERNAINAGDYSINAIATGKSEIVIVYNDQRKVERYTTSQYISYIRKNEPEFIQNSVDEFPGESEAFVNALAIAKYLFSSGQYSASAGMYQRSLSIIEKANADGRATLQGMVIASYYGSGRHVEGLRFICQQYKSRPKWDYRFRHAIHAHLRSLTQNLGHQYAKDVLNHIRQNPDCRRDDFTPVWIPIHLTDMRWLENSIMPDQVTYGFSTQEDKDFAAGLLKEGNYGFMDYLHFINKDYNRVIQNYPKSYIYDLALLGNSNNDDYQIAKASLLEYLTKYKRDRLYAVQKLAQLAKKHGDTETSQSIAHRYAEMILNFSYKGRIKIQIDDYTRVWIVEGEAKSITADQLSALKDYYAECKFYAEDIRQSKYVGLLKKIERQKEILNRLFSDDYVFSGYFGDEDDDDDFNGTCISEFNSETMENLYQFIKPLANISASNDTKLLSEAGNIFKFCGDVREKRYRAIEFDEEEASKKCGHIEENTDSLDISDVSFHRISANLLRRSNELDPIGRSRELFVAALSLRNNHDYEDFLDIMQQYVQFYPKSPYADDALSEIGWYYLAIADEPAKSDTYFDRVIRDYKGTNAYDNALNWLVISKKAQGSYAEAAYYSVSLLKVVISDRIRQKIVGRTEEINQIRNWFPDRGQSYVIGESAYVIDENEFDTMFYGQATQIVVASVRTDGTILAPGDVIREIDGVRVRSTYEFFRILTEKRHSGTDTVSLGIHDKAAPVSVRIAELGIKD